MIGFSHIMAFLGGALVGANTKNQIVLGAILGGAINVILLWSSLFPALDWWQQILNNLPFIGWIFGGVQTVSDLIGAMWAFVYGAIAGVVGWFFGKMAERWL